MGRFSAEGGCGIGEGSSLPPPEHAVNEKSIQIKNRGKQVLLLKNIDMNHYELDGLKLFVYLCPKI